MSGIVRTYFHRVFITDENWKPLSSITRIDMGMDGQFVIPRMGVNLTEADFVFFAERAGACGVIITKPDGTTGRFTMNTSSEGEEFLEGTLFHPAELEQETPAEGPSILEEGESPLVKNEEVFGCGPKETSVAHRATWIEGTSELLPYMGIHEGKGMREPEFVLEVPHWGEVAFFDSPLDPGGTARFEPHRPYVNALCEVIAVTRMRDKGVNPPDAPSSHTRKHLVESEFSLVTTNS
jgi:hypothetical protein